MCQFATTDIEEYDDPVTGWSYTCTADATSETCGGDTITRCVSFIQILYLVVYTLLARG